MKNAGGSSKATVWFIVVFVVVVTVLAVAAGVKSGVSPSSPTNRQTSSSLAPPISPDDRTTGKKDAAVSVIEYGDFECPACGVYEPIVERLISEYGDRVIFSFRNFPLPQHRDAQIASQAAEAAGLESKYWEMYDLLYKNQSAWSAASPADAVKIYFDQYASSLGLDVGKFNDDLNSATVLDKIKGDIQGGISAQIDHTPTFFINLKQIPNPQSYDEFKAAIDNALAS